MAAPFDTDYLAHSDFKTLAENAPDIIARFDRELNLLYINPAVEQLTGLSRSRLVGRHVSVLPLPPELINILRKRVERVFQNGAITDLEWIVPTPKGKRHYSTRLVPVQDESGTAVSVMTVSRDVTERVQSEERQRFYADFSARLVESPDYESTLHNLVQLMLEVMADGCAIDVAVGDGTMRRAMAATKDAGVTIPEGSEEIIAKQRMSLPLRARGRILGMMTLVSADARHGFEASDVAFAQELAARAALIVDNARLYQEARDASLAKSAFLATMSHELRTPLNAILGYTELMELGVAGSINEQQTQQLGRISSSAWHLLSVIEEILTFSRVEAGREEVRLESISVQALLAETAAMIEPIAARKALDFRVELIEDCMLRTDRGKVRQILLNLLSNAVKFTDTGSVSCSARAIADGVQFEVCDTGSGIAEENLERVFEPFWQAAPGTAKSIVGTGLGLAVSRQLAHLLGGDIQLRSTIGTGSTFTIFIPAAPAHAG